MYNITRTFQSHDLWASYPPRLSNRNKRLIFELAYPGISTPTGEIIVRQITAVDLPQTIRSCTDAIVLPNYYDYKIFDTDAVEWHVNFADKNLFGFYGSDLFAQDELQVCEHPVLGCVREALSAEGLAFTEREGKAYPVLIKNVERKCSFDLRPHAQFGLPNGIYGNAFRCASPEAIRACTKVLESGFRSNLIAIAAPNGYGEYTRNEIEAILATAFSAFHFATIFQNDLSVDPGSTTKPRTIIHTGWWGCGAFGGNRELMAMLQYVASEMAGVSKIIFHAGDPASVEVASRAFARAKGLVSDCRNTKDLIRAIGAFRFHWGESNGT